MPLSAGDRLGPYVIAGTLGAGGMGQVYRARDPRLDRDVAIKIVHAAALADPEWRARFTQEAKAVSALSHPNIVTVHDIGTEGDVAYMVMELVDGQTLERLIPASGMRLGDVLRIGAQIADACARAHAAGIIHRDLKPANIIVPPDGRVRVLDFGIAKLVAPVGGGVGTGDTQATGTSPGMVLGTAAYMSPEQAEGRPLDARSDIFSLGAVLYEMTTGRRPFAGDSPMATVAAVLQQEPQPIGELRSDAPAELVRLIMRCLRKDPARRVQSMADLAVALEELREDVTSGRLTAARPAPASRVRTGTIVIAAATAAVAIAITAGAAWWLSQSARRVDVPLQPIPLTTYPGREGDPSFSPDGTQLAFRWDGERQDNSDIYVMLIGGSGSPLRLTTDPHVDLRPRWSPDGRQIGFLRVIEHDRVRLLTVPPLGGPERTLGEFFSESYVGGSVMADICWTPDSRYLILAASQQQGEPNRILRVAVDSGEVSTLAVPDNRRGYTSPSLSPDGRTLAMVHADSARGIELLDLSDTFEARGKRTFSSPGPVIQAVQWSADGRSLLFDYFLSVPLPLYRVPVAGGEITPLSWMGPGVVGRPAIHGGRMIFGRAYRDSNIIRIDLQSGASPTLERIAQSSFRDVAPQYSPDGTRLVFYSNRSGSIQLWTANADGSQPVQLTSMDALATTGTPRWSPDGREISFDSNAGGTYHIYVISSGGGKPRQLTSGAAADFVSSWSPDGQSIYFTSGRSGREEIWRMPAGGGTPQQVTTFGAMAPTVSADGRWLYFTKSDGADGLWRIAVGGGTPERVADRVFRYNYTVTRDRVYYVTPQPSAGVWSVELATGARRQLFAIDKPLDLGAAISPDGRYLLFTQVDYAGEDLMLVENFR